MVGERGFGHNNNNNSTVCWSKATTHSWRQKSVWGWITQVEGECVLRWGLGGLGYNNSHNSNNNNNNKNNKVGCVW